MSIDFRLEKTEAQEAWLNSIQGILVLEQTRTGNIIFCDMKNRYKPLFILTPAGTIQEIYSYYDLTTKG